MTRCPITNEINCVNRKCELHYSLAPLRLAPAPRKPARAAIIFAIYVACIPLANLLVTHLAPVPVGFGFLAPAGVFVAGVAFTARDLLQRWAGRKWAVVAILAGTVLSLLLADPRLALASAAAFAASELIDMGAFTALERRSFAGAVLTSNVAGLVVDSAIFLWLAFGSLAFLPGQILGKLWMTLAALVILVPLRLRARAA